MLLRLREGVRSGDLVFSLVLLRLPLTGLVGLSFGSAQQNGECHPLMRKIK